MSHLDKGRGSTPREVKRGKLRGDSPHGEWYEAPKERKQKPGQWISAVLLR